MFRCYTVRDPIYLYSCVWKDKLLFDKTQPDDVTLEDGALSGLSRTPSSFIFVSYLRIRHSPAKITVRLA